MDMYYVHTHTTELKPEVYYAIPLTIILNAATCGNHLHARIGREAKYYRKIICMKLSLIYCLYHNYVYDKVKF